MLMVGNSLTHLNVMPKMLEKLLSHSDDQTWRISAIARGGATLDWHIQQGVVESTIRSLTWHGIIFQDQSLRPRLEPEASRADLETLTHFSGDTPTMAYATWDLVDGPENTWQGIENAFSAQSEHLPSRKIGRAGRVWDHLKSLHPQVQLRREDGKHPTELVSLLAAMALCHGWTGRLPPQQPPEMAAGGYGEPDTQGLQWPQLLEGLLEALN